MPTPKRPAPVRKPIIDLRSDEQIKARRERARTLAKQAVGMQAAQTGTRVQPGGDSIRQKRIASRRAPETVLKTQDELSAQAAPQPTPDIPIPVNPESTPIKPPVSSKALSAKKPARTKPKFRRVAQYPIIAIVALAAAYSASIGQWFVFAFAIYALIRRLDSRYAFGSALFLLITIPLFSAIGQSGIAQNAAIYVYELLVIGTILAIIELRQTSKAAS